jgi:hypothetical protein
MVKLILILSIELDALIWISYCWLVNTPQSRRKRRIKGRWPQATKY